MKKSVKIAFAYLAFLLLFLVLSTVVLEIYSQGREASIRSAIQENLNKEPAIKEDAARETIDLVYATQSDSIQVEIPVVSDVQAVISEVDEACNIISHFEEIESMQKSVIITPKKDASLAPTDWSLVEEIYVEVSISEQHAWLYIDGELLAETDVVTGKSSTPTPLGTWSVKQLRSYWKIANSYWCEFAVFYNGNYGIHDSSHKRSEWGGDIYLRGGSNGCTNTPLEFSKLFFEHCLSNYHMLNETGFNATVTIRE